MPHYPQPITSTCLSLGLDLGRTATHALGFRALKVRGRDPALVVCLGARGDSRAVGTNDSNLVGRIDSLGSARRLLGTLTTLAAPLLLGEEGADPGVVDKVDSSAESAKDDKVEEYTRNRMSVGAS